MTTIKSPAATFARIDSIRRRAMLRLVELLLDGRRPTVELLIQELRLPLDVPRRWFARLGDPLVQAGLLRDHGGGDYGINDDPSAVTPTGRPAQLDAREKLAAWLEAHGDGEEVCDG